MQVNTGWLPLRYMPISASPRPMQLSRYFGPSTLITAAFIGPGTVTLCTMAGVTSGFSLVWALVFSCITTIILQEMAARLGTITGKGIPEAVHATIEHKSLKAIAFVLIFSAVVIGNSAYEAGNISGAAIGMELMGTPSQIWPVVLGVFSIILIWYGGYKWIEKILTSLVMAMSLAFLITAIIVFPGLEDLIKGLIPRSLNNDELILATGLVGTTVVPYNLFLHAAIVSNKWHDARDMRDMRIENRVAVILGGLISLLIIIVAAGTRGDLHTVDSAADLAVQLEPLAGQYASRLMGVGLSAAGLSSVITAAIAAAYVTRGIFKIEDKGEKHPLFRLVWMSIIVIGVIVSMLGINLIVLIKFAQLINAIILLLLAVFLLYLCNSTALMGTFRNSFLRNTLGIAVILIVLLLSIRSFILLF